MASPSRPRVDLIILCGFVLHFLRNLLVQRTTFDHRPLWLFFTGCEIAALVIVSGLLWSRRPLSRRSLRVLELTIFGMIAAIFAWVQVGGLALLPVGLMGAGSLLDRATGPHVLSALPEAVIMMATAVFGSHKIRQLQEQAHEPQRLGQYRLKQALGFGGMGTAYLAEHVLLSRPVPSR